MINELTPVDFFQKNKYIVVKNFLPKDVTPLYYQYCKMMAQSIDYKMTWFPNVYHTDWDGRFNDEQCPNVYSKYADILMESTILLMTQKAEQFTGLKLNPNYTYWRLYEKGCVLERHKDRPSCEISATINLGSNNSNIDENRYPNYEWPIFVKSGEQEIPIRLEPGDALIYRGCEIEHWREEFMGLNNAQVFFHWSDKNGEYKKLYDDRPIMGIPKKVR